MRKKQPRLAAFALRFALRLACRRSCMLATLHCRYLVYGLTKQYACDKLFGAWLCRIRSLWCYPGLCQRLWHLCHPYLCHLCLWEHPWRSARTRRLFKISQSCTEMQCSQPQGLQRLLLPPDQLNLESQKGNFYSNFRSQLAVSMSP